MTRCRRLPAPALLLLPVLALAGCGGSGQPGQSGGADGEATSAATEGAGEQPGPFQPAIDSDFPDPDVLEVDGTYYAYATNGNLDNVRVARSTDLQQWQELPDAFPELPSWVIPGKTWAPEVTEVRPGRFVLYFTATDFEAGRQCIGVARAQGPEGPFEAVGEQMLVCPAEQGGAIDASTYRDGQGRLHLLWKNDGNCCGQDTWLHATPLTEDGLELAGDHVRLVKQDQPWEGHLVEAPTLLERDGTLVLLYSANDYGGESYAVGYATAPAIEGPWTKGEEPLLTTEATGGRLVGPGGQDVVTGPDGQDRLLVHAWQGAGAYRAMHVLPLEWDGATPRVPLRPQDG